MTTMTTWALWLTVRQDNVLTIAILSDGSREWKLKLKNQLTQQLATHKIKITRGLSDGSLECKVKFYEAYKAYEAYKITGAPRDDFLRAGLAGLVCTGNPVVDVLDVALSAGGAGTALALALHGFLGLHKGKKVIFGPSGEPQEVSGYSAGDVENLISAVAELKKNTQRTERARLGQQAEQLQQVNTEETLDDATGCS